MSHGWVLGRGCELTFVLPTRLTAGLFALVCALGLQAFNLRPRQAGLFLERTQRLFDLDHTPFSSCHLSSRLSPLASDIDPDMAGRKVETYFDDIPAGPPIERDTEWVAKRTGIKRGHVQDRVPQSRVYMVWNIPSWRTQDSKYLDLVSDVLAVGKTSRLYKRLVYDDQIATDARAYVDLREIGGLFYLDATVQPGGDTEAVEAASQAQS